MIYADAEKARMCIIENVTAFHGGGQGVAPDIIAG